MTVSQTYLSIYVNTCHLVKQKTGILAKHWSNIPFRRSIIGQTNGQTNLYITCFQYDICFTIKKSVKGVEVFRISGVMPSKGIGRCLKPYDRIAPIAPAEHR